ncbi:Uncharacterized protein of the uridine kinase family [Ceraceosorus bombacis]|uniref:Uncharacterized protein of the uridine kinase family n=1 Tax=Ceraceosorus bombacis TaxID=401625 RepID=A0A0N7LAJ2_9BASI|nr:Uncharacterized protein of the uridine kinase family [Ceraceosorus bombacis]
MTSPASPAPVLLFGIGGATSSGKSTLAAHLSSLLNHAYEQQILVDGTLGRDGGEARVQVVGQDDFALPEEQLRYDERIDGKDWDDPDQCIDYARFATALEQIKSGGTPPVSPKEVSTLPEVTTSMSSSSSQTVQRILELLQRLSNPKIFLVDGFLLYYDSRVTSTLDVRLFLRASEEDVRSRREGRVYHTAEGTTWSDPPNYFDLILWPSYVKAHQNLFEQRDVERGALVKASPDASENQSGGPVSGLRLLETRHQSLEDVVQNACQLILEELQEIAAKQSCSR